MPAETIRKPRKSLWGWGIAAVYSLFALGTLGVVAFTMTQKVELVSQDYYASEVAYEQQIERMRNTSASEQQAVCELSRDGQFIEVSFPASMKDARGTLLLYRPSASALDRTISIAPDAQGAQRIPTGRMAPGLWRAKLLWKASGQEYYREYLLHLSTPQEVK